MPHLPPSRRSFVRQLLFGQAPSVSEPGRSTLVVIFLRGGADTLNIVVPHGDDAYYASRPGLAVNRPGTGDARDQAIGLDDYFGLHPHMASVMPLWESGRLAIVNAVGSDNPSGSHFAAQDQIEHGETFGRSLGGGWLGRYLRARGSRGPLSAVAIGETIPESLRGAPSAAALRSVEQIKLDVPSPKKVAAALSAMYRSEVGFLGDEGSQTLELLNKVAAMQQTPYTPEAKAAYPSGSFGEGLREVARLIKADVGLEAACIDLDGWDTHFLQGTSDGLLGSLVKVLAEGLAAFDEDLNGMKERVTTVVMTEFGRRLYQNGSAGTDHGRGFSMFVLGSGVNGGVHGRWPGLDHEASFPGPGGLEITTDYRSVLWEVATSLHPTIDKELLFPGFTPESVGSVAKARSA